NLTLRVNPALAAAPTASMTSVAVGETIAFAAGASGGSFPYLYSWEFGDGGASPSAAPAHAFATAGTYAVRLWVNDSAGGSIARTLQIHVGSGSSPNGPAGEGPGGPSLAWYALGAGVAVVVVAAVVLGIVRGRRGSRRPPTAPPTPPGANG
ncbi:MAG TPA: PKD domain-containing protein, partial [Thermoplasmata archaeon]|nr:PKD domain-containing protein [Thermoplasmata archaeon]